MKTHRCLRILPLLAAFTLAGVVPVLADGENIALPATGTPANNNNQNTPVKSDAPVSQDDVTPKPKPKPNVEETDFNLVPGKLEVKSKLYNAGTETNKPHDAKTFLQRMRETLSDLRQKMRDAQTKIREDQAKNREAAAQARQQQRDNKATQERQRSMMEIQQQHLDDMRAMRHH